MQININNIESLFERTMLYFYNYLSTSEIVITAENKRDFLNLYCIKGISKIDLPIASLIERNDIEFTDNSIEEYKKNQINIKKQCVYDIYYKKYDTSKETKNMYQFMEENPNSSIYNIVAILIWLDKLNIQIDEYLDSLECKCYNEAYMVVVKLEENLIMIENSITSFILQMHRHELNDMSSNYRLLPDIITYCKLHKKYLSLINNYIQLRDGEIDFLFDDERYPLMSIFLSYDILWLRRKMDVLKFILSLICIIRSPEYSVIWKKYSYELLNAFQDIFHLGTIHKILLQKSSLKGKKDERGSDDKTTRIEIIFSIANEDIFILRIDLGHKGVENPHLNLEECIGKGRIVSTGYPIKYNTEEYKLIKKLSEKIYSKLFFEYYNRIWFRTDFLHKLEELDLDDDNKNKLIEFFKRQSHREINLEVDEIEMIMFLNELQNYIEKFRLTNVVSQSFGKEREMIFNEVKNIRKNMEIYRNLEKMIYRNGKIVSVHERKIIWDLYADYGLKEQSLTQEDVLEMDIKSLWECINRFCL